MAKRTLTPYRFFSYSLPQLTCFAFLLLSLYLHCFFFLINFSFLTPHSLLSSQVFLLCPSYSPHFFFDIVILICPQVTLKVWFSHCVLWAVPNPFPPLSYDCLFCVLSSLPLLTLKVPLLHFHPCIHRDSFGFALYWQVRRVLFRAGGLRSSKWLLCPV